MFERIRQKLELPQTPWAVMHLKMQSKSSRILLCFIGGTLVWLLYFMFVYALNSLTCFWGWFSSPEVGLGGGLQIVQIIASIVAVGMIAGFGVGAFREGRKVGAEDFGLADESVAARDPLLAFVTLFVNCLFILIIAVSLIPILTLHPCVR